MKPPTPRAAMRISILFAVAAGCAAPTDNSAVVAPAAGPSIKGQSPASPVARNSHSPAGLPANEAAAAPADQPRLAVAGKSLRWFLPPNGTARSLPFGTA